MLSRAWDREVRGLSTGVRGQRSGAATRDSRRSMQHEQGLRELSSCRIRQTDEGRTRYSNLALSMNQQGAAIEQCCPVLFVSTKTAIAALLREHQFALQLQRQREIGRPGGYRPSAPGPALKAANPEAGAQGTRRGKRDEDQLPGRGRTGTPLRVAEDPAEPQVLGLEGTARTDRHHIRPRAALQQQKASADPHPGQPWGGRKSDESRTSDRGPVRERVVQEARGRVQSRGDPKPGENRSLVHGPAAKAATREGKVQGMKGEARENGRVPGPGQTRVPTQGARDQDA